MHKRLLPVLLAGVMLLGACNLNASMPTPTVDVYALYTAAAETLVASLTQTAAVSPTPLPTTTATEATAAVSTEAALSTATLPPLTPIAIEVTPTTPPCDAADYIADVNIPDGTVMSPGQDFVKTWLIKNIGSCPWGAGYQVVYAQYAVRMDGQPLPFNTPVNPGDQVEISVQFKAPAKAGEYLSAWRMANALGQPFGEIFYVKIVVK